MKITNERHIRVQRNKYIAKNKREKQDKMFFDRSIYEHWVFTKVQSRLQTIEYMQTKPSLNSCKKLR